MPTFDASQASCSVTAYKDGLLAAVGHNVRLEVGSFEVQVSEDGIEASFDAGSLRAVCAVKDGRDDLKGLSDKDRATIDGYVRNDILESRRHPKVVFRADSLDVDGEEIEIEGELQLHGQTRDIELSAQLEGDFWVARVRLRQSDFGIRPFKALMGTLKIKSEIDVELRVPSTAISS